MCSERKKPYSNEVRQKAQSYFENGLGYKAVARELNLPASITRDWGRSWRQGKFRPTKTMSYATSLLLSMKEAGVDCVCRKDRKVLFTAYLRVRPTVTNKANALSAILNAAKHSRLFERGKADGYICYTIRASLQKSQK